MPKDVQVSEEKPLGPIQRENPETHEPERKEWVSDVRVVSDGDEGRR